MKIKEIKATGFYVVLKAIESEEKQEEKKTEAGIILLAEEQKSGTKVNDVNHNGKVRVKLVIDSIGPDVDQSKYGFAVGDECYANDYDLQTIADDEGNMYALCKAESVKCVIKAE